MASGKARDGRKEQQWRQRIQQWQASGLSVRAFCAAHGLAEPSFYFWRRALAERQPQGTAPPFVPVQVVAPPRPDPSNALELVLGNNRSVRIPPGFDAATLRQLLAVLEGKPC